MPNRSCASPAVNAGVAGGKTATVPFRALIPEGTENILVAGRALGSDRAANSALRVQAVCMATGQAAGVAAAWAARQNQAPKQIPLDELKATLRQFDAIVP